MGYCYKDAGVDVESGYKAVELMKDYVKKTSNKNVLSGLGGFGGLFDISDIGIKNPVLVSGTDGVGTKLKVAFEMDIHDTIGQDCVAMCVNDIVAQGAKPLFFLDYLATGKLEPEKAAQIVKGVSKGCMLSGSALIGGETAEMPGFYQQGEYDIAGFAVGIVDKDKIINGSNIAEDDVIIGLKSSGIHSNGYSLVRRLVMDDVNRLDEYHASLGCTVGEEVLKPTFIYADIIQKILSKYCIKGIAHITGGGFYENIPRVLPEGLQAEIRIESWPIPPIFKLLKDWGDIETKEMFSTFNMGIGMALVCDKEIAQNIVKFLSDIDFTAFIIGSIKKGNRGLVLNI